MNKQNWSLVLKGDNNDINEVISKIADLLDSSEELKCEFVKIEYGK